jgi:tetratricopeptide (TPR) repeat protein
MAISAFQWGQCALVRLLNCEGTMVYKSGNGPAGRGAENRFAGQAENVVQTGAVSGGVHFYLGRRGAGIPRQMPMGTSCFTGRRTEIANLDVALLDPSRSPAMVVISGTAGVGKTALVVEWARRASDAFPDGQLYVDLRGYGPEPPLRPQEALDGFIRALGETRPEGDATLQDRAAHYRTAVSGRRMLVVLDNAASEEQVRPLLPGTSSCAVIVVSRHLLTGLVVHYAATSLIVGQLPRVEAVELLAKTLGERVAGAREAVADLARQCARLPLALRIVAEFAASRPLVPLQVLTAELDDERVRLDLLDTGDDPRSAVRTVFSWSYSRLDGGMASAFRALGLHPGYGIDAYAAAALTLTSHHIAADLLRRLAHAQLIMESLPGRFEAHDLLRAYARELGEAADDEDDRRAALRRLFDYYLHTADRADRILTRERYRIPLEGDPPPGPEFRDHETALGWLEAERQNMVAMCRLAGSALDPRCWQLAYTLRGYFFLAKRWDGWVETHTFALAACARADDQRATAITHNNLGRALLETGRRGEAADHYDQARRLFTELGDGHGMHDALANQAAMLRGQGRYAEALRDNHQALEFYRQAGSARKTAITLRAIALTEMELGRFSEAICHAQEGLDGFLRLELLQEAAKGFSTLGLIHHRAGQDEAAESAYLKALHLSRRCHSRYEEARALHRLGAVAADRGDTGEARRTWAEALALYAALGTAKARRVERNLAALDATDLLDP